MVEFDILTGEANFLLANREFNEIIHEQLVLFGINSFKGHTKLAVTPYGVIGLF